MPLVTVPYPTPAFRKPSLLEERIATLQWCIAADRKVPNTRHTIILGLQEKPLESEKERYELFAMLATAICHRDTLEPLDKRCWFAWKGKPLLKSARLSSDPDIRRVLGLTRPALGSGALRHDWQRLVSVFRRLFRR